VTIAPDETEPERISLNDLVEMQKPKLRQALSRAYRSSLYRGRMKAAGVRPEKVRDLEDLALLQFLGRNELFEATRTKRDKVACCAAKTWFVGTSATNHYEWFPLSAGDLLGIAVMLARMSRAVGLQKGDIVLAITDPLPRISSVIPYLWTYSKASGLEFITGCLDWYDRLGMTWINFLRRRRPTVLFASTKNALALAEKIHTDLDLEAREVLTETRVGILWGEPLQESRAKLMETYSLETYEAYSPTEHMSFCIECGAHLGIHLWMDTCIPEIIPVGCEDAVPIWKASPGSIGELVITNFAECLPLIRYRTGESIRVEATDRCACGRTHPRISRVPKDNNKDNNINNIMRQ
jgi:phenylacetate-CoA ligase